MCWMCDHPTASREDYLSQIGAIIAETGWAVQGVERDRMRPPYAYTVGLTARGKPEFVVTGLSVSRACELLNGMAAHSLHSAGLEAGEQMRLVDGPLIEIVEVEVPEAHLLTVCEFYDAGFRALQLVHADDRDHWPWEVGYRGGRGGQPVLGTRVASLRRLR